MPYFLSTSQPSLLGVTILAARILVVFFVTCRPKTGVIKVAAGITPIRTMYSIFASLQKFRFSGGWGGGGVGQSLNAQVQSKSD